MGILFRLFKRKHTIKRLSYCMSKFVCMCRHNMFLFIFLVIMCILKKNIVQPNQTSITMLQENRFSNVKCGWQDLPDFSSWLLSFGVKKAKTYIWAKN